MVHRLGSSEYQLVSRLSNFIPGFKDIFDEESFYIFILFVIFTSILMAVIFSNKLKPIKDAGHID